MSDSVVIVREPSPPVVVPEPSDAVVLTGEADAAVILVREPQTTIVVAEPPPPPPVLVVSPGPRGAAGGSVSDVVAAVDVSGHRVVVPDDTGELVYADPTDPTHLDRPMWLTTSAVMAGSTGLLIALGELEEPSWTWTPGLALYLGLNGVLTHTPPATAAFWRKVAGAMTSTRIFFAPEVSIRLS